MNKICRLSEHPTLTVPLRLLILGAGAVVHEYYLPALRMLGLVPHAKVTDISPAALAGLQKRYPELKTQTADFRTFLKSQAIRDFFDAVIVALPNWLHEEAVLRALDCGLHVLCEKPLALTREACLRLVTRAEVAGQILVVNMVRQLLPSISSLLQAFCQGLIGQLTAINVEDGSPYAWLSDSGAFFRRENGGVLADMGVHYLDLIQEVAGELAPLSYEDDSRGGVEANAIFRLKTRDDIPVCLELSRTQELRNTALFKGVRGELVVEKDGFEACHWLPCGNGLIAKLYPKKPFSGGNWPPTLGSCFAQALLDFSLSVQQGKAPSVSARHAASTIALIEWAYHQRNATTNYCRPRKSPDLLSLTRAPVFVTGGTGFIGSNLVRRLYESGFNEITVPVRNYRTCAEVARFPVEMPRVDLLNYEEVKSAMKEARWVFHCAYGRDGPRAGLITVQGTRNVVKAAIALGCESVVILSTAAVFGYPENSVVDESWPYQPALGEYGRSKARMEWWCLRRAKTSRATRIVILNPSCVYGPLGKTYSAMPLEMARKGIFCWIEEGRGTVNYTYVDNLLDAMLKAASCKEAQGERFIINDGSITWRSFLTPLLGEWAGCLPSYTRNQLRDLQRQSFRTSLLDVIWAIVSEPRILDVLSRNPLFHGVKQMAERWTPAWLDKVRQLPYSEDSSSARTLGTKKENPPLWLADLFGVTSTVFSSEKARRVLHWEPQVNLGKGQELTVEWLRTARLL